MKPMAAYVTWNMNLIIKALLFLLLIQVGEVISYKDENSNTTLRRNKRATSGVNAEVTDFPHAVALLDNGEFFCNGNILGPFHVITACHCVTGFIPKNFQIRAGSSYWDDGGSLHGVILYACDPRYIHKSVTYDVAILMINKPFELDNITRRVIQIWKPNKQPWQQQQQALSAGWGIFKFEIQKSSNYSGDQRIDDLNSQFQIYTELPKQMQLLISAFADPRANKQSNPSTIAVPQHILSTPMKSINGLLCAGDSGSGLVIEGKLVGLVSSGGKVECERTYGSEDLSKSIRWIETVINSSTTIMKHALSKKFSAEVYELSETKIKTVTRNEVSNIEKSPHVVSILHNDWLFCSGSIVSDSHVVTAAHCLKDRPIEEIQVRSGSSYWHTDGNLHRVSKVIFHPEAQDLISGWMNDVAIVQIVDTFNFDSKTEQPINFFSYNDFSMNFYAKKSVSVYGWVDFVMIHNDTDKTVMPNLRVQKFDAILEKSESCYKRERIPSLLVNETYKHNILCALVSNPNIIYGASGSGLIVDGMLAGIASQISALHDNIHRFLAISTVSSWIKSVIDPDNFSSSSFSTPELQFNKKAVYSDNTMLNKILKKLNTYKDH